MVNLLTGPFSTINLYLLYMKKCIRTTRNMTFYTKIRTNVELF